MCEYTYVGTYSFNDYNYIYIIFQLITNRMISSSIDNYLRLHEN